MGLEFRGLCPLLQVFDMPAALAFYRDVLGFSIVDAAPAGAAADAFGWVWLRRDDVELMLNTAYDPDAVRPTRPDPARVAAHEDTILYIGAPDVDAVVRHLRAGGIDAPEPTVAPYGMKQLFVKDPDGFGICFQWKANASDTGTS